MAAFLGVLSFSCSQTGNAGETAGPETLVDVHVVPIKRMTMHRYITLYGKVIPEPANSQQQAASAQVAAAVGGVITHVSAIEGKIVQPNDLLVQLDVRRADAVLQRSQADLKLANARFERQQILADLDDTSRKDYERAEQQLEQARAALKQAIVNRSLLDIRSPLDATVSRVMVHKGEIVSAGMMVTELVNLQRLTAELRAPELVLNDVQPGQIALVYSTGKQTQGKVNFVGVGIDAATGTAPIRISLPTAGGLHPGQFIRARIITKTKPGSLVVPLSAVVERTDGSSVIAIVVGDKAELRPVTTGLQEGEWVEISGEGIYEGINIVSREAYGIPGKTRIRILDNTDASANY